MKKLLILLLGAILIGILSYFCFLDKAAGIKDDLVSKVQSAYAAKQMNWVHTDIKGQDLGMTRILTLEGTAPSSALKAEAGRVALAQAGVESIDNRLVVTNVEKVVTPKVVDSEVALELEPVPIIDSEAALEPEPAPIIDSEATLEPEPVPIIDSEATLEPEPVPTIDSEVALESEPTPMIDVVVPEKVLEKNSSKAVYSCQEEFKKILSGGKINFASNKADIKPDSYILLDALVEVVKKCPKDAVAIGGHTDSDGSARYNLKLSKNRANAVKKYLVAKGISKSRLKAVGYGASKPIADNTSDKGKAKNRRIEFNVIDIKEVPITKKPKLKRSSSINFNDIPFAKTLKIEASDKNLRAAKLGGNVINVPETAIKKVEVPVSAALSCQKKFKALLSDEKIEFAYNKANIKSSSYRLLNALADVAKKCSNEIITISGYTDSDGSESYNKRLSSNRASAVRYYLVSRGVSSKRLKAIGYGESNPIADNSTKEGKAKNRRIEFNVKGVK